MRFSNTLLISATAFLTLTLSIPIQPKTSPNTLDSRSDLSSLELPGPILGKRQSVGVCTQNCLLYGCDCDCAQSGTPPNGAGYGGTGSCGGSSNPGGGGGYTTNPTPNPSDPGNPGPPGGTSNGGNTGGGDDGGDGGD